VWKWASGSATTKAEFGDPSGDTFRLCVYTNGRLRGRMTVPPGGMCAGKPCWKETAPAFKYKDKNATANGASSVKMLAGVDGKAQIQVSGKAQLLSVAPPLTLSSPLTVQWENATSGACWSAHFTFPPVKAWTYLQFVDKAD